MKSYFSEIRCEFLSLSRTPKFAFATLLMPVMFYVFFGIAMHGKIDGHSTALYMMSTFGCFGVMVASVWAVGASIAAERGLGWLDLKRASPMPPFAYFVAKVVAALAFSTVVVCTMLLLGALFGEVRMNPLNWLLLGISLVAGAIPFSALGFVLGYIAGPGSAPAVMNLVILPMAFCSGLWTPLEYLPPLIHRIASVLPAYHLAQLGFLVSGLPSADTASRHIQALLAFLLIFAGAGAIVWRREENKVYG